MGNRYADLKAATDAANKVNQAEIARLTGYGKGLEAELKKRQVQIKTVTKEIVREIPTVVGDGDCINRGWVRVHDAAALGVSVATREPDDAAGAVTAARAAEAVTVNYGECLVWREQLLAWQRWAAEQSESQTRINKILGAK